LDIQINSTANSYRNSQTTKLATLSREIQKIKYRNSATNSDRNTGYPLFYNLPD